MPSSLIAFLQANRNCFKADLFAISLPTGATLYATEGDWDITVPAGTPGWAGGTATFKAALYGRWSRGAITSEASTDLRAGTMSLKCIPQQSTMYPGLSIGILYASLQRLFDGCNVAVYTAYMPMNGYGNVSAGIETKFKGSISRIPSTSRNRIEFECSDSLFLLNTKVPTRVFQANCPWSFCDTNCGLTKADYSVNFTAKAGSTQAALLPLVNFTQASGYFDQGVVTCLTGNNAGLSHTVRLHATGALVTTVPWLLPIQAGDTFTVIKGCDKTLPICKAVVKASGASVNNSGRFGGTPFVPPPSVAV